MAIGILVALLFSAGLIAAVVSESDYSIQTSDNTYADTQLAETESLEKEPTEAPRNVKSDPIITPPVPKTNHEICQDMNGYYATYDSTNNTCGCASGYYLGATSKQCVTYTVARDQSCANAYPGTSFLKVDPVDGKNICDCVAGSYWNNERNACYSLSAFNQSCVSTFGTGSYSTTQDGKRVCGCTYGYDFNPQRNACVTVSSINAICERDVGRNSRYAGSSSDGSYDCTEPY